MAEPVEEKKYITEEEYYRIDDRSEEKLIFYRGDKFVSYRKIKSLKNYILVSQYAIHIEHFYKNDRGQWVLEEKEDLGDVLQLKALDCELPVKSVYRRIDFRIDGY